MDLSNVMLGHHISNYLILYLVSHCILRRCDNFSIDTYYKKNLKCCHSNLILVHLLWYILHPMDV